MCGEGVVVGVGGGGDIWYVFVFNPNNYLRLMSTPDFAFSDF